MAKYRITAPDGGVFDVTAPDGASEAEVMQYAQQNYQKADQPQQPQGPKTPGYEGYIDAYKRNGLTGVFDAAFDYGHGAINQAFQGATLGFGDELKGYLRSKVTGKSYDEAVGEERANLKRFEEHNPISSVALNVAGGLGTPGGMAAGRFISSGRGLLGKSGRSAGVGSGYGGVAGFGTGEGDFDQRLENAQTGAGLGLGFGAVLPGAASLGYKGAKQVESYVSPRLARWRAEREAARPPRGEGQLRSGITTEDIFGAAPEGPQPPGMGGAGARAQAEQTIADQLTRSGVSAADLEAALAQQATNRRVWSSGRGRDATAIVDLDPSLQRLAGSIGRNDTEASSFMGRTMRARQTGIAPEGSDIPSGIATRGSRFTPAAKGVGPTGQRERVGDMLRRSLLIKDEVHHGHQKNAYQTNKEIGEILSREGDKNYTAFRKAADGVDISEGLQPVAAKWAGIAGDEVGPVAKEIEKALRLIHHKDGRLTGNANYFDRAMRYLKDREEQLLDGRDRYAAKLIGDMRRELQATVDGMGEMGALYNKARMTYASQKKQQEALELGRKLYREDSDAGIDMFRALETDAERKLARHGYYSEYMTTTGRKDLTSDTSKAFDNPRMQEILSEMIPRGRKIADRPERFSGFLDDEQAMRRTQQTIEGNSMTARNLKDDEAYQGLSGMFEQWKQTPGLAQLGMKAVESLMSRMFGMEADAANLAARMLFAVNPQEREIIIRNIAQRMGATRFDRFSQLMQKFQGQLQAGTISGAAGAAQ